MYTPFVRVSAVSCTGPDKHYTKLWIYVSQNGKETALCRIRETDGERCAGACKRQTLINKISQNQTTKRTVRRETILLVYGGACAHSTKAAVRHYTSIRWHHNTKDHFLQYKHARWRDIIVPRPDNIIPYSAQLTYKMNYNLYPVHTIHGAAKSIPQRFIWLHISPNNRKFYLHSPLDEISHTNMILNVTTGCKISQNPLPTDCWFSLRPVHVWPTHRESRHLPDILLWTVARLQQSVARVVNTSKLCRVHFTWLFRCIFL